MDVELEAQIEALRDTQRKYANILRLARALTNHFYHVVQTQRALGDAFSEMSQKSPELQEEFSYNSETQKALCKNGEILLGEFVDRRYSQAFYVSHRSNSAKNKSLALASFGGKNLNNVVNKRDESIHLQYRNVACRLQVR